MNVKESKLDWGTRGDQSISPDPVVLYRANTKIRNCQGFNLIPRNIYRAPTMCRIPDPVQRYLYKPSGRAKLEICKVGEGKS